jgi:predicted nucleotidyltransferase
MRTAAPPLLPLLRSQAQGELLALLYLHPDREFSLTEAARRCRTSVKTIHHEANRLVEAGYVAERRLGNVRLLRAGDPGPAGRPLTELLATTYGPLPILERELSRIRGVREAYLFGSWAARHEGAPGPVPHDVDVLVEGTADADDLHQVAQRAEAVLLREVNILRIRPAVWDDPSPADPFVVTVRSGPLVGLRVDEGEGSET